ncbi:MAG: hypothetical protein A2X47_08920 [Lentisphaerae bacterium GWF2_38_69]|nr:MAG: hypothetical protein A2X47_08920 [Lentisphaerae bacterium GWF2_38_69]
MNIGGSSGNYNCFCIPRNLHNDSYYRFERQNTLSFTWRFSELYLCILCFTIISVYSVRWIIKANSYITVIKIILPITISLFIIFHIIFYHIGTTKISIVMPRGNFGVLTAISTGGIFFAFNGFKLAARNSQETQKIREWLYQ